MSETRLLAVTAVKTVTFGNRIYGPGENFKCPAANAESLVRLGKVKLDGGYDPADWMIGPQPELDLTPPDPDGPPVRVRCISPGRRSINGGSAGTMVGSPPRIMMTGEVAVFCEREVVRLLLANEGHVELAEGAELSPRGDRALATGGEVY